MVQGGLKYKKNIKIGQIFVSCQCGTIYNTYTHHFMNCSVRRHLNEEEKHFLKFFGFSVYPLGVLKWWKNLNFSFFVKFLVKFKKIQTPPVISFFLNTTGDRGQMLNSFFTIVIPWNILNTHKNIRNKLEHYTNEMSPVLLPINYNYKHPGGQSCLFWPKMTQNIDFVLITPQFKPLNEWFIKWWVYALYIRSHWQITNIWTIFNIFCRQPFFIMAI